VTKLRNGTLPRDAYTEKCPQTQPATARVDSTGRHVSYIPYIPLVVPVILFMVSLSIPPTIDPDSGVGFLVLRNMLEGGAFNIFTEPDPANISRDVAIFLSELSPGQYIVPGALVWLGISYGLALSLTTFFATLIGVVGWSQVARSFGVTPLVLFVFTFGLVCFHYGTFAFRMYHGGEILLFAAAPWALYALRWAADKPPAISIVVSLLTAALLFFAKLTGLICFAANILAISLLNVWHHRRLTSSILGVWAASGISAMLFLVFWPARDWGPVGASWLAIWFPLAGTALSGFSGYDFLNSLFPYSFVPIVFDRATASYVLGPLGLLFIIWVWVRLRDTQYRTMAIFLFVILALYTTAIGAIYFWSSTLYLEERHLRYSGVIFFLLFLVAIDQWPAPVAKGCVLLMLGAFAVYGLISYSHGVSELIGGRYYDPLTGTSQQNVPPVVLEYMRSEMRRYSWRGPIIVLSGSPEAAIALPGFRLINADLNVLPQMAGRTEKIFVIVQERMLSNGKAEGLLKSFSDYEFGRWSETRIDGMVIYSQ
jgi:hypothetical protein